VSTGAGGAWRFAHPPCCGAAAARTGVLRARRAAASVVVRTLSDRETAECTHAI
jgi:hypothetical protein